MKISFVGVSEENSKESYMRLYITVYICDSKNIVREDLAKTLGERDVIEVFCE